MAVLAESSVDLVWESGVRADSARRGWWLGTWWHVHLAAVAAVAAVSAALGVGLVVVVAPLLWLLAAWLATPFTARTDAEDVLRPWTRTIVGTFALAAVYEQLGAVEQQRSILAIVLPATAAAALALLVLRRRLARAGAASAGSVVVARDAERLAHLLESGATPHHVRAVVLTDDTASGGSTAGSVADLADLVRTSGAAAVVVDPKIDERQIREISWALEPLEVPVTLPVLWDVASHRIQVRSTRTGTELRIHRTRVPRVREGLDRVVAATALAVLSPLLLVIGLVVKLDSPGPVIFRQERTGLHGERFRVWKFRTMVTDAEELKLQLMEHNQYGPGSTLFKMKDDPRVTRAGRILRATSLDELPQLVNVVRGEMVLVGPRPTSTRASDMPADYRRRTLVRPGVTGLWQVSGRSNLSWDQAAKLDLHYVENRSAALDLSILGRTVRAVLRRYGAY